MVFPREILINKNTRVFDVSFRLETNTFLFFFYYRTCTVLVGKRVAFERDEKLTKLELLMLRVSLLAVNQS